jgi:hypothetical protein
MSVSDPAIGFLLLFACMLGVIALTCWREDVEDGVPREIRLANLRMIAKLIFIHPMAIGAWGMILWHC